MLVLQLKRLMLSEFVRINALMLQNVTTPDVEFYLHEDRI